jgi:hypothetical protein
LWSAFCRLCSFGTRTQQTTRIFKYELTHAFLFCARNDILYINYSEQHCLIPKCRTKTAKPARPLTFHILINSSEATGPIWTKLCGMVLGCPPSKIVSGDPDFQPRNCLYFFYRQRLHFTLNSIVLFPNVEPKLQSLQNADHKCLITH